MSYQRYGYPLKYFKSGVSDNYVFVHIEGHVEDYGSTYADNKSFVELIGKFIERETGDSEYAWKMVQTLSKKLGLEKELRKKPLDSDEFIDKILKK